MHAQIRPDRLSHAQLELDLINALAACVRLSKAGCILRSAHIHDGIPVVVVDRRPPLRDLAAGCLRADATGADYHANLDGVRVAWHEPPRVRRAA